MQEPVIEAYEVSGKIGEGTFGEVLRAKCIQTGEIRALKKVRLRRLEDGLPPMVLREVNSLELLDHPNVMKLHEVFPHGSAIVLVCDLMRIDLAAAMQQIGRPLLEVEVKAIMSGLLHGVDHCHQNFVLHRDLKPGNILLGHDGRVVIADFGLARLIECDGRPYSNQCATRWYRAPELLFGSRHYGTGVDMWAVGCIFAEFVNNEPLFAGNADIDQLSRIISTLGSISFDSWPGARELPDIGKISFRDMEPVPFAQIVPNTGVDTENLLASLLAYDPEQRMTAEQALLHPYFFSQPVAIHPTGMPLLSDLGPEVSKHLRSDIANFTRLDDITSITHFLGEM